MEKEDTNYATAVGCKDEASKTPYVIKGRVISSDASGNIYKSMYIQDATGAITLSINQASLCNFYPFGQEIVSTFRRRISFILTMTKARTSMLP